MNHIDANRLKTVVHGETLINSIEFEHLMECGLCLSDHAELVRMRIAERDDYPDRSIPSA